MDKYPVYLTAMERALVIAILEKTIDICDREFDKVHGSVIRKLSAVPIPDQAVEEVL